MRYRPLGSTGIHVSELSFGGSPLGGSFGELDPQVGIRAVHRALDLGINLFDVAPLYGDAEMVLGRALRGVSRERFHVSTKVGRYGGRDFDFSSARVTESIEESLRRIGVDHLDIALCHDIEFVPLTVVLNEALPALRRAQSAGKICAVGVSGLPLKIFRSVLQQTELDVVLSYCHYTLADDSLAELAPVLREKRCGIINAAPLAMGLLREQGPPHWHPADAELREAVSRAAAHCASRGASLPQLALAWSLADSPADTTLVGMTGADEVERNIALLSEPPDSELLAALREILRPVHNRTWLSGLPENN